MLRTFLKELLLVAPLVTLCLKPYAHHCFIKQQSLYSTHAKQHICECSWFYYSWFYV